MATVVQEIQEGIWILRVLRMTHGELNRVGNVRVGKVLSKQFNVMGGTPYRTLEIYKLTPNEDKYYLFRLHLQAKLYISHKTGGKVSPVVHLA